MRAAPSALVIKMQPYNSLNSSNMRMLAMMKGLYELGIEMELVTRELSAVSERNDMSDYAFLEDVKIVSFSSNARYEQLVSSKSSWKQALLPIARKIYHRLSLYDNSLAIANKASIDVLERREYDYVISVSDPKTSHVALRNLLNQGLKAKKIIQYWGDPLYGDVTQRALYPGFVLKREERKFLRLADKIVYTSPFTLENQRRNYPEHADKMIVVPTANASQKIYPPTQNEVFTVGYYGAYHSRVRNLLPLYEAFAKLQGVAKLNLVGDSDLALQPTANVMLRPRGVVKDLEEKTDLFVCVLNRAGTQIPGKAYHTAATNRPILVLVDGDEQEKMIEYLKTFDRFIIAQNNVDSICKAIQDAAQNPREWAPCPALAPKDVAAKIIE